MNNVIYIPRAFPADLSLTVLLGAFMIYIKPETRASNNVKYD